MTIVLAWEPGPGNVVYAALRTERSHLSDTGNKMTGKRTSYFSDRSEEERRLAANTNDKMIARIHLDLAARYDELAESTADNSPVSRHEIERTGRLEMG